MIKWRNSKTLYGLFSIKLHWVLALLIIGLFISGVWMVSLGYYHPWYSKAPSVHQSFGIIAFSLVFLRLCWRFISPSPKLDNNLKAHEKIGAKIAHFCLDALALFIILSGYLITSDGSAVGVPDWFSLPSLITGIEGQATKAGLAHEYAAWAMIILVIIHALAALKHHFIDRDNTLKRIIYPATQE